METILLISAVICGITGIVGAVAPALPGPPLSFLGLLLLHYCNGSSTGVTALVVTGLLAAAVTVLDYIAPVWLAGKSGGSKSGKRGAAIGVIIGLFFMPIGLILGPFLGALLGELAAHTPTDKAFKVAFMSFIAFMLTTGIKLIYSIILLIMIAVDVVGIIW